MSDPKDPTSALRHYLSKMAMYVNDVEGEGTLADAIIEVRYLEGLIDELEYNLNLKIMQLEDYAKIVEAYKQRFNALVDLNSKIMAYIPPAPIIVSQEQFDSIKEGKNVN